MQYFTTQKSLFVNFLRFQGMPISLLFRGRSIDLPGQSSRKITCFSSFLTAKEYKNR